MAGIICSVSTNSADSSTNPPQHNTTQHNTTTDTQVYTALEKKALALIQLEENKQKEATILANFRKALEQRHEAKEKAGGGESGGEGK